MDLKSPSSEPPPILGALRNSRGQVIIEYILLMVLSIGIAAIVMRTLVSKNQDSPGALIQRWQGIIKEIGADDPNKR